MNIPMDEFTRNVSSSKQMDDKVTKIPIEDSPNLQKQNDSIFRRVGYYRRWSSASLYAAKKTVAQGMMDIALITANANQLRYILEYDYQSPTFYTILLLIILSMCLQVIVGIILIFKGRYDFYTEKFEYASRLNNYVVFIVFLITVINVFIAAFTVKSTTFTKHE